jgi:hypothetical protein
MSSVVIGQQQSSSVISSCEKVPATVSHRHSCVAQQRCRHRLKIVFPSSPIVRHRYPMRIVIAPQPSSSRTVTTTQPEIIRTAAAAASSSAGIVHR